MGLHASAAGDMGAAEGGLAQPATNKDTPDTGERGAAILNVNHR